VHILLIYPLPLLLLLIMMMILYCRVSDDQDLLVLRCLLRRLLCASGIAQPSPALTPSGTLRMPSVEGGIDALREYVRAWPRCANVHNTCFNAAHH
jgi:hypothetical protein